MDFIGGALPNVMFIVGIIAIGIGLGIEFKLVEIKSDLSKRGRIGAFSVGAALIAASIFLYIRPPQAGSTPTVSPTEPTPLIQTTENTAGPASSEPGPAPASPTPPDSAPVVTTAPPVPADPLAELNALFAADLVDDLKDKESEDLNRKLRELQEALAKGDQKRAKDRLRDLQKELQKWEREGKLDAQVAQAALATIQQVAAQYGLKTE